MKRPPWRTVVPAVGFLLLLFCGYVLWSPGLDLTDGRHDLGRNGIWLQHGWLADDRWFARNRKKPRISEFRDEAHVRELAELLRRHHITDVFPHLCPTRPSGVIPAADAAQAERFLDGLNGFRVMPWIGGARGVQAEPQDAAWRAEFCRSARALLEKHPRFAGVHVNIEPCPSGSADFLLLLEELRRALPAGKIISVAAYPPPTVWHRFPDVHWEKAYFQEVARRTDQMAVMMYDTSLTRPKLYRSLMASWTREALAWSGDTEVLLGLPTYADAGSGYHDPAVENLANALLGVHAGLGKSEKPPRNYQGTALYCEWETDPAEWAHYREHFLKIPGKP